ncbi:RNA polymerase sigma factor [Nannocystis radixulma]|uniref:Sigma-70 family RNA polymerase sigma factor n=1 Tax=Nannocystis radixulma TaxID=2995305 RepID=A0ABT5BDB8_9BACT|nr:sigma-70 family RNA polymerase sigma factor [Nannocystis radixulma]MDC0672116.1 sigma-70 family RNA polymerase sigma factor [Nannocystis radixulma]
MSTDAELVDGWRRGERDACAQLFERYYDGLARFFRSKLPEAADDLVQRTFLRCFEGLARIADATAFRSYLFGIACNVLREHYRSIHRDGARLEFTSVSAQELAPSASAVIGWQQEQRLLLEALRRIPLEDQILLELCYWEQLPGREIAAIVGTPLGTVKAHLRRARQRLEAQLEALARSPGTLHGTRSDLERWAAAVRQVLDARELAD